MRRCSSATTINPPKKRHHHHLIGPNRESRQNSHPLGPSPFIPPPTKIPRASLQQSPLDSLYAPNSKKPLSFLSDPPSPPTPTSPPKSLSFLDLAPPPLDSSLSSPPLSYIIQEFIIFVYASMLYQSQRDKHVIRISKTCNLQSEN